MSNEHLIQILQITLKLKRRIKYALDQKDYLIYKKIASRGINNFQIDDTIANIGDDDLTKNFVGDFPSNYMNKFIDHATIMKEKGQKPFYHS